MNEIIIEKLGIGELFRGLTEKERNVLLDRFGFHGEKKTLKVIGKELGITRERVRQIEKSGLDKLESIYGYIYLKKIKSN